MIQKILTIAGLAALSLNAQAQTLRIKCNSIVNLQVVAVGVNSAGHLTSIHIDDLSHDDWKRISLYNERFGYDNYNNSEMQHESTDSTWRWQKIIIYGDGMNAIDSFDLTKPKKKVYLNNTSIWAKVKIAYDRKYVITDVILNDD